MSIYIFTTYKENLYRAIAIFPFIVSVTSYFGRSIVTQIFPHITSFYDLLATEEVLLTAATANNLLYAVPVMFSMLVIVCMIMTILLIFKNLKNNVALLVFLVGLASRLIIGFSPTVFVSGQRTMIFFEFAMIIVAMLVWQELIKKNDKNDLKIFTDNIQPEATNQIYNLISQVPFEDSVVRIMPDVHCGMECVVGFTSTFTDKLIPNVIGVDISKDALKVAKENAALSGLADAKIRYIGDDCKKFVEREIRRGNKYDAIIMDPPSYGRGPTGEVWKIEENIDAFVELMNDYGIIEMCRTGIVALERGASSLLAK